MTTEFSGTWTQEMIKNAILSFTGLGFGAALYMVGFDIRKAIQNTGHIRRLWISRAMFALGFVVAALLWAEAIYKIGQPLPIEWRVLLYTGAVMVSALGGLGVAYETRRAALELKKRSFEIFDVTSGNTIAGFRTLREATAALADLTAEERHDLVIVEFDERGFAV